MNFLLYDKRKIRWPFGLETRKQQKRAFTLLHKDVYVVFWFYKKKKLDLTNRTVGTENESNINFFRHKFLFLNIASKNSNCTGTP